MTISKKQFNDAIDELFPIQVGNTYLFNGQEVVVIEATTENGVEGFKVSNKKSQKVLFAPKDSLLTKSIF
ncbi:MAG: hypothetical protein KF802_02290 [Bdellovibrionaceae bacterium]|nr:hypothetical protein [Pseudobdellovibrionaceae bacterium]